MDPKHQPGDMVFIVDGTTIRRGEVFSASLTDTGWIYFTDKDSSVDVTLHASWKSAMSQAKKNLAAQSAPEE
jgi:hypothetical protein